MKSLRILLPATFRRQRGTFLGILMLTLLSSLCLFVAITLLNSGEQSVSEEMDRLGYGDFTAWVNGHADDIQADIEALPDTGSG